MQDFSISSHFVRAVIKHAADAGLDSDKLLLRAGIAPRLLSEPGSRVTLEQFALIQSVTMRGMNDEYLGYGRAPINLGAWAAMCHWTLQAKNLSQALKRFCQFYGMINGGPRIEMQTLNNRLHVRFLSPYEITELEPYAYELFMFSCYRLANWLTETKLPLDYASFGFAEPIYSREYRGLFLGSKMLFDAPLSELVLPRQLLEMPVKNSPQKLTEYLRRPTLNILRAQYNQQSWEARVRDLLSRNLSALPTFEELAGELGIHPKKLHRCLEEEGVAYTELKSQLRRDIAIHSLLESDDTIETIAYKVGYSESCTFVRAFRSWTGVTPHNYRRQGRRGLSH
ncbi:AraC family transcriptional regulator [Halioxenophilus sp. WMMB6]|uniref:AraC family transcriptional regulator n=1 Tax=Halioxenophilus sp. WMMB6 TaxID=3073815 RepID=UPI00295EAFA5|nr:AraC family transcriptional regulator [Halioxenophilus sp. WMMB6]